MCEHAHAPETQSETIGKLAAAMAKAQLEIKHATKSKNNPFFKSRYADLADVRDASVPALSAHGLAVLQTVHDSDGDTVRVDTILAHESGEWIRSSLTLPAKKAKDPQALGSSITYARRYAWATIAGVATDDDDGNAASGDGRRTQRPATLADAVQSQSAAGPADRAITWLAQASTIDELRERWDKAQSRIEEMDGDSARAVQRWYEAEIAKRAANAMNGGAT